MQHQEKKIGVLRSWNEQRGFGIIRVGDQSSLEKYFLHVSQIRSGTATPSAGMTVCFDVSEKPAEKERLRKAINADIDVDSLRPAPAVQS
jgi:cold shock CspA family protein